MGARVDFVCFEDFVNDAHGPDSLAQPHSSRTMKPRFGCSLFFSGATWYLVYEIKVRSANWIDCVRARSIRTVKNISEEMVQLNSEDYVSNQLS
jgi:hypothetical protein